MIGDAAVTTNPWYGKGCAQAGIAAEALSAALREHGRDGVGVALAMDEAMRTELEPHYVASCAQDADRIKLHAASHDGSDPDPVSAATRDFILNGLIPATRDRPRRVPGLLPLVQHARRPQRAVGRPAGARRRPAPRHATKDERPPQPELGPPRDELLAVMAAASGNVA